VEKRVGSLHELWVSTGVENLSLIAGAMDSLGAANVKHQQKLRLLRNLQALNADYVFLDLGAGTSLNTLDFFLLANHGIVVLLPEPTSIENAYRFVKAAFFRHLHNIQDHYGIADLVDAAINSRTDSLKTPYDFVQRVRSNNPKLSEQLEEELRAFRVRIVVNQARTASDKQVGNAVAAAWVKFFGLGMDYLGAISYDDEAWRAIRKRRPLLLERADCEAAIGLNTIVDNLIKLDAALGRIK
jgi:flagellar biosynthesis protein FlhG